MPEPYVWEAKPPLPVFACMPTTATASIGSDPGRSKYESYSSSRKIRTARGSSRSVRRSGSGPRAAGERIRRPKHRSRSASTSGVHTQGPIGALNPVSSSTTRAAAASKVSPGWSPPPGETHQRWEPTSTPSRRRSRSSSLMTRIGAAGRAPSGTPFMANRVTAPDRIGRECPGARVERSRGLRAGARLQPSHPRPPAAPM